MTDAASNYFALLVEDGDFDVVLDLAFELRNLAVAFGGQGATPLFHVLHFETGNDAMIVLRSRDQKSEARCDLSQVHERHRVHRLQVVSDEALIFHRHLGIARLKRMNEGFDASRVGNRNTERTAKKSSASGNEV